jgi:branched-chain amino acid aminotransferase
MISVPAEEHIDRLWDSARAIARIRNVTRELVAATLETIRQNDLHDGYIRLIVTGGLLGLSPDIAAWSVSSHHRHDCALSGRIVSADLTMVTCSTRRTPPAASVRGQIT